jgi:hypothetical protein
LSMTLSVIEWFVAVIAVMVLVKVVLFNLNPKKWIDFSMKNFKNFTAFRLLYLVVFFVLAYYLLQEITLVQFFAGMMAGMFLYAHTMMHYPSVLEKYVKNFRNRSDLKKLLLDWVIWVVLSVLVLKELFL